MSGRQKNMTVRFAALAAIASGLTCGGDPMDTNEAPVTVGQMPPVALVEGDVFTGDIARYFDDPDDDELAYTAVSADASVAAASVAGSTITVRGVAEGTTTVTVTATDPDGASARQTAQVTVAERNVAPVVDGEIDDRTLTEGDTVVVDVSGNFSDPNGDDLTFTAESGAPGTATVTVDGAEVEIVGIAPGAATVTVTATDPGGLSVADDFDVTVERRNRAPVVDEEIDDQTLTEGDTVVVDVSDHFSDPDGDTLTYEAASRDTLVATSAVDGAEITIAGVAPGAAAVTVTATDPGGLSATQDFDVTVERRNQAPVPVDTIPPQTMVEGDSVTVDVTDHFSDPDGDTLTYAAASGDTLVATAAADGAEVTITGVARGSATVTVTATDPGGLSATQEIDVTVEHRNRAPEPVGTIPPQTVLEEETVTVDVTDYFTDPDGDTLTYTAESADTLVAAAAADGAEVTITGVAEGGARVTVTATDPGGLSATQEIDVTVEKPNQAPVPVGEIPPASMFKDEESTWDVSRFFSDPDGDTLAYTAESSDTTLVTALVEGDSITVGALSQGDVTITITATDPEGLSATQTAEITVENRAPVVEEEIPPQALKVGESVTLDVMGNFSDPDGDQLTYSAGSADTLLATATVDGAEVEIVATGNGLVAVSITATDPGGLSATLEVEVEVAENHRPRAVGELEDHTLVTDDTVLVDLEDLFTDPDGDTLTYTAESTDDSVATATTDDTELTIAATGGGVATVTVIATDRGGLSDSLEASIMVNPPVVEDSLPVHDLFIVVDTASDPDTLSEVILDVRDYFGDPDGDDLTYTASTEHDSVAEVEEVDGSMITTVPVGVDTASLWDSTTITVTATDPHGMSVSQKALVRVAHDDYEEWDDLEITDEGRIRLGGFALSGCVDINGFVFGETVYTVHRSEWQRREGTGWIQLTGTYRELKVCAHDDLPDEPAGTYRLAGEVTTWPADTAETDPGDTVRALRKSANTIEIEDDTPPPADFGPAPDRAPGPGLPLPARGGAALIPGRGNVRPRPVPRSRRGAGPGSTPGQRASSPTKWRPSSSTAARWEKTSL